MKAFKNLVILSLAGAVAAQDLTTLINQVCTIAECKSNANDLECISRCARNPESILDVITQNSACILGCNSRISAIAELVRCTEGCINKGTTTSSTNPTQTGTTSSTSSKTTSTTTSSATTMKMSLGALSAVAISLVFLL
ncbi:hypothetical protein BB560_001931 [Smittium megazygosporum]|uniref:Extracellular membrane protein CFEM domain-containing protein n=1 Tax=Smittium megazygosporum TaxID=133381 RepID=A0A2T9ZG53_9FUNG|nr:hypothetical protein BB560_001931 [Smittium megazygosporum]